VKWIFAALASLTGYFLVSRRSGASVTYTSQSPTTAGATPASPSIPQTPIPTLGGTFRAPDAYMEAHEHLPGSALPEFPWEQQPRARAYLSTFRAEESAFGIPAGLLSRVAYQESRFDPHAISPAGAIGLMQFLPATAAEFGIDARDPAQSIRGAAEYLSQLFRQFGSWTLALAAYNWGPGNLARKGFEAAPGETRDYVSSIAADVRLG
jgi:soluble lytic murein transglycosylase-like protein